MSKRLPYPRELFSTIFNLSDDPSDVNDALLQTLLDTVFFASLMPEEGEAVPIGVVYEHEVALERVYDDGSQAWLVWRIQEFDFNAINLKKMAHGVEYGRDLVVVAPRGNQLKITALARRAAFTDGGAVLRVAAPRPGVLVLEGRAGQLCGRYNPGAESLSDDVAVLWEEGLVSQALTKCGMDHHRWMLTEMLRHARVARAGAIFYCMNARYVMDPGQDRLTYQFQSPSDFGELVKRERRLLFEGVAAAQTDGHYSPEELERRDQVNDEFDGARRNSIATAEMLGRLAANDGAVLIEPGFHVVGSGFFARKNLDEKVPNPRWCRDAAGTQRIEREHRGGARHAAGFRFAWENKGCVVFIVSSDGPVTCALRDEQDLLAWSVQLQET
ncbi:putative sensor domain DACNV-containing protein [Polyangium sorediatum]|uniref:Probable sensor domain-containing protein n=1 Tax=Polyangium sorediatum TaxID=889274 RepID=A0ABT6NKG0_9BACT|nr:hypothetical protein [Polyangium sorediatum]MDI1428804.1 hypothetical protein [Polyangium sorediatum]